MLLFWKVRYLDTRDRQFKDRLLKLDTKSLDPVTQAAVETIHAMRNIGREKDILRYRTLFQDTESSAFATAAREAVSALFTLCDYFEDEQGTELTYERMGPALTGDPHALLFPPGTRQHDIGYCLAEKPVIDITSISLSQPQLTTLAIFHRDLTELRGTAVMKEGPGTLMSGTSYRLSELQTAVSDEEIRSFVTIYRRLYMENEPANFSKAVAAFAVAVPSHPLMAWVQECAALYESALEQPLGSCPMVTPQSIPFSRKRLIDVFLYTQYAHQPEPRRVRQFNECLAILNGDDAALTWLFLTEIWKSALEIVGPGTVLLEFYQRYCECHGVSGQVLPSVREGHPGIGALEKKAAQEDRVLRETATKLARVLWEQAGSPNGGPTGFFDRAFALVKAKVNPTA
jgi:hypothetical protein